jgi:hypothetical protein
VLYHQTTLAILTALLWISFPIHTEAVANIKSRDEVLSTTLTLLAFVFFLYGTLNIRKRYVYFALSSCIVFAATTAKEIVLYAPFLFIVIYWIHFNASKKAIFKTTLLFLLSGIAYFSLRYSVLGQRSFFVDEASPLLNIFRDVPFWTRIWTANKLLFMYISKSLVPVHLLATYAYNHIKLVEALWRDPQALIGLILLILFL